MIQSQPLKAATKKNENVSSYCLSAPYLNARFIKLNLNWYQHWVMSSYSVSHMANITMPHCNQAAKQLELIKNIP